MRFMECNKACQTVESVIQCKRYCYTVEDGLGCQEVDAECDKLAKVVS